MEAAEVTTATTTHHLPTPPETPNPLLPTAPTPQQAPRTANEATGHGAPASGPAPRRELRPGMLPRLFVVTGELRTRTEGTSTILRNPGYRVGLGGRGSLRHRGGLVGSEGLRIVRRLGVMLRR